MSTQTLSLFGRRSTASIPACPKCKVALRLMLTIGRDGLEEYVYKCSHCRTMEARANGHASRE